MADLPSKVRAKFFKGETGHDYVEISIIGDPNTVLRKVGPEDTVRFPKEWESYQSQAGELPVTGTPLIEVPGIDNGAALGLRLKGVRTAEELAGLDESAAKALGHGIWTFCQNARNLLKLRDMEAMQDMVASAPRRGRPPKAEVEATE
jgi:hypothetical protein